MEESALGPPEETAAVPEIVLVPARAEHVDWALLVRDLLQHSAGQTKTPPLRLRLDQSGVPVPESIQRVVVAPSTVRGITDASALISTWRPALARPVLVVVRDAPLPPPSAVVNHTRALSHRVQASHEIPYLPQLRMVYDPAEALLGRGRALRRARRALNALYKDLYLAGFWSSTTAAAPEPLPRLELDTWESAPSDSDTDHRSHELEAAP